MQMRWVIVITIWSAPAEGSVDSAFPVHRFSVRGSRLVGLSITGHCEPQHLQSIKAVSRLACCGGWFSASSPAKRRDRLAKGMEYTVATFYHFADLPDFEAKQVPIKAFCDGQSVLGTIILAPEGINGTIAGPSAGITATLDFLRADERLAKVLSRGRPARAPAAPQSTISGKPTRHLPKAKQKPKQKAKQPQKPLWQPKPLDRPSKSTQ